MARPTGVRRGITNLPNPDRGPRRVARGRSDPIGVNEHKLRGAPRPAATPRQVEALGAYVTARGSVPEAAAMLGIRPSTLKRHLADMRARSGLTTEQLIYAGRAAGWLVVPSLEPAKGLSAVW